jgi:hypothetical protein
MTAKKTTTTNNRISHGDYETGTKNYEIGLLEKLFSFDSYLADSMTEDDLRIMKNNINNDFPIFMGTSIDQAGRIERLQGLNVELEAEIKSRETRILDLEVEAAKLRTEKRQILHQAITIGYGAEIAEFYTPEEILKLKIEEGLELSDEEKKTLIYLIEQ